MADATELCSSTDLQTMLGLSATAGALALIKASTEAWAKAFTGRDLLVATYTEYYSGDGSNTQRTYQRPIVSVTSIHVDASRAWGSETEITSTYNISSARDYELGYIEIESNSFTKGRNNVRVIYSAGYATVPVDLSMAVKQIICQQYKVADKQLYAEVTQQVGDRTITLNPDAFPKNAVEVLKAYRRTGI